MQINCTMISLPISRKLTTFYILCTIKVQKILQAALTALFHKILHFPGPHCSLTVHHSKIDSECFALQKRAGTLCKAATAARKEVSMDLKASEAS